MLGGEVWEIGAGIESEMFVVISFWRGVTTTFVVVDFWRRFLKNFADFSKQILKK
jgi:hypothetical protein